MKQTSRDRIRLLTRTLTRCGVFASLTFFAAGSFLMGQGPAPEPGAAPHPGGIVDRSELPRVLLLGDSISQGYTPAVRKLLAGLANVHQAGGGSTPDKIQARQSLLESGTWAVIHFNCGLHDLKHWRDGRMDLSAPRFTSPADYEKNLTSLVAQLRATGARLVWASTTPVPRGANGRVAGDEILYNGIALRVMEREGIPVNDLHAIATLRPELQRPENVHFSEEGSRYLGEHVARAIREQLGERPGNVP